MTLAETLEEQKTLAVQRVQQKVQEAAEAFRKVVGVWPDFVVNHRQAGNWDVDTLEVHAPVEYTVEIHVDL